jgi:WD40 repeat protein
MKKIIFSLIGIMCSIQAVSAQKDTLSRDTIVFSKLLDGHKAQMEAVAFSSDGVWVASAGWDNEVRLYKLDSLNFGVFTRSFGGHRGAITTLAIQPGNKHLVSGSRDNTFNIYDLQSGKIVFTGRDHLSAVTRVLFDPSGRYLMTSSLDKTIRIYDMDSLGNYRKKPVVMTYSKPINDFALSPAKFKFMVASDASVVEQVGMNGKSTRVFTGHTAKVNCLAISNDMKWMATGSDDKMIRLWNPKTGLFVKELSGHTWKVTSLNFSLDGRYLVSTCNNGEVKVWNVESGLEVAELPSSGNNARQAVFAPNMKYIALATFQSGTIFGANLYKTPYTVYVKPVKSKGAPAKGGTAGNAGKSVSGKGGAVGNIGKGNTGSTGASVKKPIAPTTKKK